MVVHGRALTKHNGQALSHLEIRSLKQGSFEHRLGMNHFQFLSPLKTENKIHNRFVLHPGHLTCYPYGFFEYLTLNKFQSNHRPARL